MPASLHQLFGVLILAALGAFIVFAFRQGTRVPRSGRRDSNDASPMAGGSDGGSSHDSGGGFGHG